MNGAMLVFGAGGQVGRELIALAGQRGVPLWASNVPTRTFPSCAPTTSFPGAGQPRPASGNGRIASAANQTGQRGDEATGSGRDIAAHLLWVSTVVATVNRGSLLNPQHFFWDEMVEGFGYPFLKRELFLDNPEQIPIIAHLADVLAPSEAALAEALLRSEVERRFSQKAS